MYSELLPGATEGSACSWPRLLSLPDARPQRALEFITWRQLPFCPPRPPPPPPPPQRSVLVPPELGYGDKGEQEILPGESFELLIEVLRVEA